MFDATRTSLIVAVKAAQTLMNILQASPKIATDGIWGPETSAKFANLPGDAQGLIDGLFTARGHSRPAVVEPVKSGVDAWVAEEQLRRNVREAISRQGSFAVSGVSPEDYLMWVARMESAQRVVDGVRQFKSNSISPNKLYKGIFQFGAPAYSDVARTGRIRDLPPFSVAASTPSVAAEMAVVYSQLLIGYLRKGDPISGVAGLRGPVTREILYGAHNQGAIGLLKGAKNALSEGGQSSVATSVIRTAVSQIV